MFYNFLLLVHCGICLLMVLVVLLQSGRGAGLAVFGGGGDSLIQTPSGSSFMKSLTTYLAVGFAFTSLFLTLLSSRAGMTSVTGKVRDAAPALPAPANPAPVPGAGQAPMDAPKPQQAPQQK